MASSPQPVAQTPVSGVWSIAEGIGFDYVTSVSIDLARYERGAPFEGDAQAALNAVQDRLAQLQLAQLVHRRRTIVIIEGWAGNGRNSLKHLAGSWDPCHFSTHATDPLTERDDERHWLAPFWSALPPAGETTIFFRSWYVRLVIARVFEGADEKRFARMCDEINEFEAQQCDHGTLIVKLFFHLGQDRQAEILRDAQQDPWRQHLLTRGDQISLEKRGEFQNAVGEMFEQTNTRWAPWRVIDANHSDSAVINALEAVAEAMAVAIPSDPPKENETVVPFRNQRQA